MTKDIHYHKEVKMSKTIKIETPLDENSRYYLEIGEKYSTTIRYDERLTLTILNPNQAKVSCTVKAGAGQVALYKNGTRLLSLADTYTLSTEPGFPTSIRLNTNTTLDEDTDREIVVPDEEFDEEGSRRSLSRQYGIPEGKIKVKSLKDKYKLIIPDDVESVWEVYLVGSGSEANTFLVEVTRED